MCVEAHIHLVSVFRGDSCPGKRASADAIGDLQSLIRGTRTDTFMVIPTLRKNGLFKSVLQLCFGCLGTHAVACLDRWPDFLGRHVWVNDQNTTENVYVVSPQLTVARNGATFWPNVAILDHRRLVVCPRRLYDRVGAPQIRADK